MKKLFSVFIFLSPSIKKLLSQKGLSLVALLFLAAYTNFIFIEQPLKGNRWLSKVYKKPLQKVLQIAEGHVIDNKGDIRILKIKRGNKLFLEFLVQQDDKSYLYINSVVLKGTREAYFDYWNNMISLQVLDDDGDGQMDVIAPSFDNFLRPKTNLIVYNKRTMRFELKSVLNQPGVISSETRVR